MIRFACPTCSGVLSASPKHAGTKIACPSCGQRLQVPQLDLDRTVQGKLLPPKGTSSAPAPAAPPSSAPQGDDGWHFRHEDRQFGPMSRSQLQQEAAAGRLAAGDLVWKAGMKGWTPARAIVGLISRPGGGRRWLLLGGLGGAGLAAGVAVIVLVLMNRRPEDKPGEARPPDNKPGEARPSEKPTELTTEELVHRSKPSVALIRHRLGSGTGFLVKGNLLVTNSHVVRGDLTSNLQIYFPSGGDDGKQPRSGDLLYEDARRDLAILRVAANYPALPVAARFDLQGGEKAVVIGSPGAPTETQVLENAVTLGVMSTQTTIDGLSFYHLTAQINPGNSGGPVFDKDGQVIGVVTLKAVGKEGQGFAIPVADLQEALGKVRRQSVADQEKTASQHDALVVSGRLNDLCLKHLEAMQIYQAAMQAALGQGKTATDGYRVADNLLRPKLNQFNELLFEPVRPSLPRLRDDARLPASARQTLGELADTYIKMKALIKTPESQANFNNGAAALRRDFESQLESLKTQLGVAALDSLPLPPLLPPDR